MAARRGKISSVMFEALRSRFDSDGEPTADQRTLDALVSKGLLESDGSLTWTGELTVLERLPLDQQCCHINLPLYPASLPDISDPEKSLGHQFRRNGFEASYCEGGAVLTLLKSAALEVLAKRNLFHSREDACTRYLEAQLTILAEHSQEIVVEISQASSGQIRRNFEEIYAHPFVQEVYPGLYSDFIEALFEALNADVLASLTQTIMEEPYEYRKGWPDLTLVKDGKARFAEVKTSDRLHRSQLTTIPKVAPVLPAEFCVVQLSKGLEVSLPVW